MHWAQNGASRKKLLIFEEGLISRVDDEWQATMFRRDQPKLSATVNWVNFSCCNVGLSYLWSVSMVREAAGVPSMCGEPHRSHIDQPRFLCVTDGIRREEKGSEEAEDRPQRW